MMELKIWEKVIELKEVFTVSREAYSFKRCIVLALKYDGQVGYGEATEFEVYGSQIDRMRRDLETVSGKISGYRFDNPADFWNYCYPDLYKNPFAQCALDVAAHDLWGKLHNKTTAELLGITENTCPKSSISIPIEELDKQISRIKYYKDWPFMKIKVASDKDVAKVKIYRHYTDAIFRVDANCGWTVEDTIRYSRLLSVSGVDMIEQPLEKDDYEAMEIVKRESYVPLMADESFRGKEYIDRCVKGFHGINLKLMKAGGITPALDIIKECREKGLKIMIGCMPESTIGISAIGVLAPLVDDVDMDSIELIATDFATGVRLHNGEIINTGKPGLGFTMTTALQFN